MSQYPTTNETLMTGKTCSQHLSNLSILDGAKNQIGFLKVLTWNLGELYFCLNYYLTPLKCSSAKIVESIDMLRNMII